ncbi:sugar ABC transporter substrate-binding protein [Sphingobium sp. 22B]|uniref:SLBB domain-containing protein n=1 Tax=unclassified Sphingobium TaxID=2611147 RepID=UPI0007854736|nr:MULTISPECIES: SLBB domain-containing protein [unclassified Sphingobium]KXU32179.1 sugar ABC transporter substrate-binding protein [Sphingobium sp. AM]KYC32072.1 sugar ABC transporter substrate-binding protein [Sphingobium sp. 22B]OAP33076.1 sugar ABC transporter substrate-binding protein [Sphingobium sp. 20006FA]
MKPIFPALSVLILASLSAAVPAVAADASPGAALASSYILGANDEIRVSVFGAYPFDVKTRIKEDGSVTLPSVGEVVAQGVTANALATKVRDQLKAGGYFVNPIVNVEVVSYVSRAVTVFGNLQNPGVYPLDRPQTIAMMLARTGGARTDAADYAILQRQGEEDRRIPLEDLNSATGTGQMLRPGDSLFVPKAEDVFIYGQVNKPGKITYESGMTLRQMLAQAGGPTLGGSEKKISLNRGNQRIKRADLDMLVKPGDVFTVQERIF